MPSLVSQILALVVLAFCFWLGLILTFNRANVPLAGFAAAIMSWVIATMSLAWALDVLRRTGGWPLV
jgi:hypothetical protein